MDRSSSAHSCNAPGPEGSPAGLTERPATECLATEQACGEQAAERASGCCTSERHKHSGERRLALRGREATALRQLLYDHTNENPENGCLEWAGALNGSGYGAVSFRGQTYTVHRLWWLAFKSDIPAELVVMHLCDNRKCVRHLALGTQADNFDDMMRKGRQYLGRRLTVSDRDVIAMRRLSRMFRAPPLYVARAHAQRLGISPSALFNAITGRNRRNLNAVAEPVARYEFGNLQSIMAREGWRRRRAARGLEVAP